MTSGLLEKMIAQLGKVFYKIAMNTCMTISLMLLGNLFMVMSCLNLRGD